MTISLNSNGQMEDFAYVKGQNHFSKVKWNLCLRNYKLSLVFVELISTHRKDSLTTKT